MLDVLSAGDLFVVIGVITIACLLLGMGVVMGYLQAKKRYISQVSQLVSQVESLEAASAKLNDQHKQLSQDHAGLKYQLGSLQRDKAYLESRLNS